MKSKDIIKLLGIKKSACDCDNKLSKFANLRNGKPLILDVKSVEYSLYKDWVISLSNLIDDIKNAKYLFDDELYNTMKNFCDSSLELPDKYNYIANEIKWDNYKKSEKGIVTIRILLDAFRDKMTHSIKYDKEAEYKLFCLIVNEIIMINLHNLCLQVINDKLKKLTFKEKEMMVKLDSDIVVQIHKLQEFSSNVNFIKFTENLDDEMYGGVKKNYFDFLKFIPIEKNIFLNRDTVENKNIK